LGFLQRNSSVKEEKKLKPPRSGLVQSMLTLILYSIKAVIL